MIQLDPALVKVIEEILQSGKSAEIAVRNGKIVVWAVASKKKIETPVV